MWTAIIKIIELIIAFIKKRKDADYTRINKINSELNAKKDDIIKIIEKAHKDKNLKDIRKIAAE